MSIPILFDKPLNVWLGLALIPLLVLQMASGIILFRGRYETLLVHRLNALLLSMVMAVHAFYGIGVWFFDFTYG